MSLHDTVLWGDGSEKGFEIISDPEYSEDVLSLYCDSETDLEGSLIGCECVGDCKLSAVCPCGNGGDVYDECGQSCKCLTTCNKRILQNGIKYDLEMRMGSQNASFYSQR
eukprot:TRINITY_DN4555_c0_g1_i4.p1 TRINITY_DN4555_c0_g1~~TRINITY_DN4555_c0_g1_i4.p1  ORF type:complete len:110 (+),score=20.10 TRINITY_DN4555_c0_g1_i4:51-380(+)